MHGYTQRSRWKIVFEHVEVQIKRFVFLVKISRLYNLKELLEMRLFNFANFEKLLHMKQYSLLILNKIQNIEFFFLKHWKRLH